MPNATSSAVTRQYRRGQFPDAREDRLPLRGRDPPRLARQEDQRDAQHRRHDGHPQQRCDLVVEQFVAGQPQQRADHGACGVHRAVEAEDPAAGCVLDAVDQQSVARRPADSLAQPVDDAARQHSGPRRRRRDDHLAQRRHAVAGGYQRTSRVAITQRPRRKFGQRRGPLGDTLNRPDDGHRRAQHRGQIDRQQRVQQLAGGVLQE